MKANDSVSGTPSHYKGYFEKPKGDGDWDSLASSQREPSLPKSVMTGYIQLLDHKNQIEVTSTPQFFK